LVVQLFRHPFSLIYLTSGAAIAEGMIGVFGWPTSKLMFHSRGTDVASPHVNQSPSPTDGELVGELEP
jgi:hypothetical protein